MISVTVHQKQINDIKGFLDGNAKKIRQQLYIATNKAAYKTKATIAKEVGKGLNVKQKIIKKTVFLFKAKSGMQRTAKVTQKSFKGLPVSFFKAKQTKAGVVFRPSKGKGAITIPGAFMGPKVGAQLAKWRGNAFKREGQSRLPIEKQHGPSALEVFTERNVKPIAVKFATNQLQKEITERARFLGLKKSGAI